MECLNVKYNELQEMDIETAKSIVSEFDKESSLEDISMEVNGVRYGVDVIEDGSWEDDGKYQYKTDIGILCTYDKNYNVVNKYNVAVISNITRSGSYFSEYYYEYEDLEVKKIIEKVIPEQIIPEHTIVVME